MHEPRHPRRVATTEEDIGDDYVLPAGDAAKGAKLFKKHCAQCHSIYPDNRGACNTTSGPTMWNVYNRAAGVVPTHFMSLECSGIVWNDANLMRYMYDPAQFMKQNVKMNFFGIRNKDDRVQIVHYLKTLNYNHPQGQKLLQEAGL